MFHCGSRGFGHQVATDYLQAFLRAMPTKFGLPVIDRELACAPFASQEGRDYYAAMCCAANMSFANRQVILHRIREVFSEVFRRSPEQLGIRQVYDVAHNTAKLERHVVDGAERSLLVHRKGATRAFPPGHPELPPEYRAAGQPVIIGGSMETGSFLLAGQASGAESFFSTAHGSGRTMSRTRARKLVRGKRAEAANGGAGHLRARRLLARPRRGGRLRLQERRRGSRRHRGGRALAARGTSRAGRERQGMSGAPAFEFLEDVTSDLCFVARGDSLPAVFSAAAAALLEATVEEPAALRETEVRRLELTEPDLELLLLAFLNELIFLRDAQQLLLRPRELRVESAPGEARLRAELVGERIDPSRHGLAGDVKAATAHGLKLARANGGFRATVTLDV